MTRWRTALTVAALAGVLGLAGCGEETDEPGASGTSDTSSTAPEPSAPDTSESETAPAGEHQAVEVVYSRSGGIAGDLTSYTFAAGQPPPQGFTARQQERVLELASSPALQGLPEGKPPKDLCCDLFVYEVTITWADDGSRTFRTADSLDAPPPLDALIRAAAG